MLAYYESPFGVSVGLAGLDRGPWFYADKTGPVWNSHLHPCHYIEEWSDATREEVMAIIHKEYHPYFEVWADVVERAYAGR